ncbi:hypothetical protein O0L34_g3278 [Tuta absoluta]|nr:hypothetical protein O0L34_g3278 [Tuta absoluta]
MFLKQMNQSSRAQFEEFQNFVNELNKEQDEENKFFHFFLQSAAVMYTPKKSKEDSQQAEGNLKLSDSGNHNHENKKKHVAASKSFIPRPLKNLEFENFYDFY